MKSFVLLKYPVVTALYCFLHSAATTFRDLCVENQSAARNNYMYVDRNIVDDPCFRIAAEDNRGVYVPAESIPASGNANWVKGRKSDKVGRVLEMNSEGKNNQFAFVADATWRYFKDGQLSVSYTWNDAKDNTSYTGNPP